MVANSLASSVSYAVYNADRGVTLATRVAFAGTSSARKRGLMGIESLDAGAGLWIAPCGSLK
jgi:uncharacterized membrane protein (UPF0127 family)